jgi:flagellar hook-associated protein 2
MVTQVQLGRIYQSNGRTVLGGSQSALDTESIITSLVEAKRQPAVVLETNNKKLDSQKTAFTELRSILARFQTAAKTLSNPPGVANDASNIFQYRTTTLATNDGVPAASYLTATVQPGVATQGFAINEISQIARETKQSSNNFLVASTTSGSVVTAAGAPQPGKFQAGTFSLRVLDGGPAAVVTLNDGDTLQAVANKFNDVKNRTGIQATLLKVADGTPNSTYRIVFTATKTGLPTGFDLATSGTVTGDPDGVLSQLTFTTNQTAQNSRFKLDGVQIEREINAVSDAVTGVTFNLKQTTPPATTITLGINPDTEIVKNAITQFADVYNEFRTFNSKQTQIGDDGLPLETAVLANNAALRSVVSSIAAEVARVVGGITGGNPSRLADVGIDFDDFAGDATTPLTRNIITIDADKLSSALQSNFDGVQRLFEYQLASDNAALSTFKRTNALGVSNFTLTIDRAAVPPVYKATYTDSNNVVQTVDLDGSVTGSNGLLLKGKDGTVLDGLELIFASTASTATINVTTTQGIGDRVFNALENILNDADGLLTNAETDLVNQKDRNSDEITSLDEEIADYRDQLVAKFSALESALARANSLLQLLDAQINARNN